MTTYFADRDDWWSLPRGPRNTICDVAGVTVGHTTLLEGTARTGVTAIVPQPGDLYRAPLVAGAAVLNGFGKSAGLTQLRELGRIESPILLTNTFAVPVCTAALIQRAIEGNPGIGRGGPTVNALVLECNDGVLNDIQNPAVTTADITAALAGAAIDFAQGAIGAGTGMRSFGLAGGIGSASRQIAGDFMLGVLVLSNFGQRSELRVMGKRLEPGPGHGADQGSIIIIMATDAPLCSRQLSRVARRAASALGRLGSSMGHGSGDIAVAFSTANRHDLSRSEDHITRLNEERLDGFFLAAVEATEEAVLNAMWCAESRPGYDGTVLPSLRDLMTNP